MLGAYVDLAILEALLQVVIDGLVGNLADQSKIRHSDLLLLGRLECRLLDLGLAAGRLCGSRVLLSSRAFGYGLQTQVSGWAQSGRESSYHLPWWALFNGAAVSCSCIVCGASAGERCKDFKERIESPDVLSSAQL